MSEWPEEPDILEEPSEEEEQSQKEEKPPDREFWRQLADATKSDITPAEELPKAEDYVEGPLPEGPDEIEERARKLEAARRAEEARKAEEAIRIEALRRAEEARKAEDARREEEARKAAEQAQRAAEEARRIDEVKRAEEEAQRAEEARRIEEEIQRAAEEARRIEEARRAEEARMAEEARRAEEETRRAAEEARRLEEVRRAGEARMAEKARLAEEEVRRAEGARKAAEEAKRAEEEAWRAAEEARRLEPGPGPESENLLLKGLVNLLQPTLDIKMEKKKYQRWIKGWDKAIDVHIENEGHVHVLIKDNQLKAALGKAPRDPDIILEGEYEAITNYLNGELDPIMMFFDFILLRKIRLVKGLEIKLSNILDGSIFKQARELYRIDKILKIK